MLGLGSKLKPNILNMGKAQTTIFITDLGLGSKFKPKPKAIMGKPKAPILLAAYPPAWATSPRGGRCCRRDEKRAGGDGGLRGSRSS